MTDHDPTGTPHDGRRPLRIGDADRRRITDALQEHAGAGRLDMDEFERRVEHATAAVYDRDLEGLLDDLPPLTGDGEGDRGVGGRRSARRDHRPTDEGPGWWPSDRRWRTRAPWARRTGIPAPLLLVGGIALVVLTHGWILFPLLFIAFSRGGGMCSGQRGHRQHAGRHDHGAARGHQRGPRHAARHDHDDGRGRGNDHEDHWDQPMAPEPRWPGRYVPDPDDREV